MQLAKQTLALCCICIEKKKTYQMLSLVLLVKFCLQMVAR